MATIPRLDLVACLPSTIQAGSHQWVVKHIYVHCPLTALLQMKSAMCKASSPGDISLLNNTPPHIFQIACFICFIQSISNFLAFSYFSIFIFYFFFIFFFPPSFSAHFSITEPPRSLPNCYSVYSNSATSQQANDCNKVYISQRL